MMNGSGEQWGIVQEELSRQTGKLQTTIAENMKYRAELTKLRTRVQNIEILKEEKRDLERKVARLEEFKTRAMQSEGELEAMKHERQSWQVPASSSTRMGRKLIYKFMFRLAFLNDPSGEPSSSTPTALTETMKTLRQTNASLTSECQSLQLRLQHVTSQLADSEQRLASSASQIATLENSLVEIKDANVGRVRRVALLEHELESTKTMLATYVSESASGDMDGDSSRSATTAAALQRVAELEQILTEYSKSYDELRAKLEAVAAKSSTNLQAGHLGDTSMEDTEMAIREDRSNQNQLESGQFCLFSLSSISTSTRLIFFLPLVAIGK